MAIFFGNVGYGSACHFIRIYKIYLLDFNDKL